MVTDRMWVVTVAGRYMHRLESYPRSGEQGRTLCGRRVWPHIAYTRPGEQDGCPVCLKREATNAP